MRAPETIVALSLFACGACSLSTEVLELPANDAAAMAVVMVRGEELTASLFSFAPGAAPYISVPLEAGDADVFAFRYACSLEALELAPGPVELAPDSEPGRLLPEAAEVIRAELRGGRASAAMTVDPSTVPEVRLRSPRSACVSFEQRRFDVPDTELAPVSVVLPLPGDRALVATIAGRVWEATYDGGLVELTRLSTTTPILGGFRAGDGELFVVGERGRAMRGRVDGSFVRAPSTTSTISFLRSNLSGNPEGPLAELFLVDAVKSFEHFDGDTWTRIDDGAPPLDYDRGGVAWLGPGHAFAAGLNIGPLAQYDRGVFSRVDVPLEAGELIRSLRSLARYGVVIATSEGQVLQRRDAGWTTIYSQNGGLRLVAPLDRGLIFGGTGGFFVQMHPGFGACEGERLAERDSSFVAELEHGFLFATDPERGVKSSVAIVRRVSEPLPFACPLP